MFGRKQQTQLAKNIVAQSERVIKLGEDAADSLGSTARAKLDCEPCKVVLDRGDVRIEIGDLARRRQGQFTKLGSICTPAMSAQVRNTAASGAASRTRPFRTHLRRSSLIHELPTGPCRSLLFEAALMPSAGTISREIALFLRLRTLSHSTGRPPLRRGRRSLRLTARRTACPCSSAR